MPTATKKPTTSTGNKRRPARSGAELTEEQNAESGFTASKQLSDTCRASWWTSSNSRAGQAGALERRRQELPRHPPPARRDHRGGPRRSATRSQSGCGRCTPCPTAAATRSRRRRRSRIPPGRDRHPEVVDLVTERLEATIGTCREVHDAVDEEDPTSADILHAILESLEQFAWMVSAENRTPAAQASLGS